MIEFEERIRKFGKCCVTGKPLIDCQHINVVQLDYRVRWKHPTWGNLLTGQQGLALAIVHDDMMDRTQDVKIKFAIEMPSDSQEIIYHALDTLEKVDHLFFDSPDAGHPDCRCSRCGEKIGEDEVPIRAWPQTTEIQSEYRYCTKCQDGMGFKSV